MDKFKTTKHRLFRCLEHGVSSLMSTDGVKIMERVQSIEREDGSGMCWNVCGYVQRPGTGLYDRETVFVRTVD